MILIDDAERMRKGCIRALLKTLEEPPPYNVFFLITSSEREIPSLPFVHVALESPSDPLQQEHIEVFSGST